MEPLNARILDCLKQDTPFAVSAIIGHQGSTPRTSGSRMIVLNDRTIYGTIGGGLVEAKVIDACIELLDKQVCQIQEFSLNQELKDGIDMICGGHLTVWVETILPTPELITVYQALAELEAAGQKGVMVSRLSGISQGEFTVRKSLVLPDATVIGPGVIPKPLLDDICDNRFSGTFPILHSLGLEEFIIEPVIPADTLYIFGAGHVGFQLAKMAHLADFQTVVVDDRDEFANRQRFPHARTVHAVDHFNTAFKRLDVDDHSYVVILTRGHLHDQTVLEQALKTPATYIGMIGSRPKRDKIYANLREMGFSDEAIETVHSPIGLPIGAETPAEIAVSIMAEIIQIRAGR